MSYRVALTPGVTLTKIDGRSVLFSVGSGETFGLNDSAADMLELLIAEGSEIAVGACAKLYDVPEDTLRSDMDDLVQELARLGLITRA